MGLVAKDNSIYIAVPFPAFGTATYNGTSFSNIGGNTVCNLVMSLDTSGAIQWSKRLWAPSQASNCGSRDVTPQISINSSGDIFLTGTAVNTLYIETTPVIDFGYVCKYFRYGAVINGPSGNLKWAKQLIIDSIAPHANVPTIELSQASTILSNGNTLFFTYTQQDTTTAGNVTYSVAILSKLYLYDTTGTLVRKTTVATLDTAWYQGFQLRAGDNATFFTSGYFHRIPPTGFSSLACETRKWDTSFAVLWKKQVEYLPQTNYSVFQPFYFDYRSNALDILMYTASGVTTAKAYFGSDSLLPNYNFLVTRLVDSANFISGSAFFDVNQNGAQDNGEPVAPHVLIGSVTNDTVYTATRNTGYYDFITNPGSYSFRPLNLQAAYPYYTVSLPPSYSEYITGYGSFLRNRNFALIAPAPVTDGRIAITQYGKARPNAPFTYKLDVQNVGTIAFNGTYTVTYDSSILTYQGSQLAPLSHTPPVLTYSFASIAPFATVSNDVQFRLKTTTVPGDTLRAMASLTTSPPDAALNNNGDTTYTITVSSFDPNGKQVYPFKDANYNDLLAGHLQLDYIIYFQNTGTDTAFAVNVLDTLDSKLDISSFHLMSSSHPVNITWARPNVLGFYFNNILLPDSTTNETKSHGFVRFRIKPKSSVQLSDLVTNNASIYFDYNAPVKTNTVNTNFINAIVTAVNNNTLVTKFITVRPNPALDKLYFKVTAPGVNEKMAISVFDEAGRLVLYTSGTISTNIEHIIDVSRLSAGNYYLQVKSNKSLFLKKFLVQ